MPDVQQVKSEGMILLLVGMVQFVNVLDFMMVMPLGPDFSRSLGIDLSHLGYIGGAYTAAASISGLCGAFFLDRFDRKPALLVAMAGLGIGTLLGGVAQGLGSLIAARVVAGMFGGPATSLSLSIVADVVPPARRGRAMGAVMGAFSIASVLGVPMGLTLAQWGSWRMPFFAVGALGMSVIALVMTALPSLRGHLARPHKGPSFAMLRRTEVVLGLSMGWVLMMGMFVLVPNISAFVLQNLHYPRNHLPWLYAAGGVASFITMRIIGPLIDRIGAARVGVTASLLTLVVMYAGFHDEPPLVAPLPLFTVFMAMTSARNVAYNTTMSKVPAPEERASYGSLQSAVQHLACASGAFLSSQLLTANERQELVGMPRVTMVAIAISGIFPFLLWALDRRVARAIVIQNSAAEPQRAGV
jgi:predicted MFS family arabinose efflux permease